MDKELKNKDLEQVSGGGMHCDPEPGSQEQPKPIPQPKEKECVDFNEGSLIWRKIPGRKKLYDYCDKCIHWMGNSCSEGHF